jgi:hypothetical protein
MAKNDDANKASDERLEKAKEFQMDFYGKMPQREGFEGETMGITGLNNSLTDLYNTLAVLREKELQNRADKKAIKAQEDAESEENKKALKEAGKDEDSDGVPDSIDKDTKPAKKDPNDKDGDGAPDSIDKDTKGKTTFDLSIPGMPMKASPMKQLNVAALRKGMLGMSNAKNIRAQSAGLNNMYNVFSLMRDKQRQKTEAELANFSIDNVQSGFDDFNNGTFACGEYLSAQKRELAALKAKSRKLNANSPEFQEYKTKMKAIDTRVKQLNGSMEKLQLTKADFADKHGMGDQDKDGRFRYSEATRQSDSYFYMQQVMNKTAPMVIDKSGQTMFEVAKPDGSGMQMMTLEQMEQGIYEKDDNGMQYYNTMRDAVDKNHKANMMFDEGAANAGLGKMFGYNKDVNKKNVMSWIHDFPELGADGKTFIQHYKETKLPDAKVAWATSTLEQYKDKIPNYDEIVKDGISLEEAQALQKSSFEFTGETGMTDDMILNSQVPEMQYFDPDNTADWGQVSKFSMIYSGENNNERTIGEHIRDELKAYYMDRLKKRHDKNVRAENRVNGKDTYTNVNTDFAS